MVDVHLQYSSLMLSIVLFALGIIKLVSQRTVIAALTGYIMMMLASLFVFATYERSSDLSWYHRISLSSLVVLIAISLTLVYWISTLPRLTGLSGKQSWDLNFWRRLSEASLIEPEPEASAHSSDQKDQI